jgi:hypothetical protein
VPSPFQGASAAAEDDDQDNSPFAPGSSYNFITRPPGPGKSKSKLSDEQKRELCQLKALWPKSKQEDIARAYGVERSTVSKILGEKAVNPQSLCLSLSASELILPPPSLAAMACQQRGGVSPDVQGGGGRGQGRPQGTVSPLLHSPK